MHTFRLHLGDRTRECTMVVCIIAVAPTDAPIHVHVRWARRGDIHGAMTHVYLCSVRARVRGARSRN